MEERVILVNDHDEAIGTMEKMEAHQKALLHRAFSIFIFNEKGDVLLQQRAFSKYHSGGLWTNACCSHPREHETVEMAAYRRLQEEFGFVCSLQKIFSFIYKADVGQGLFEHEFDHVFIGTYNGPITAPNPEEIGSFRWISWQSLIQEMQDAPEQFTTWFRIIFKDSLVPLGAARDKLIV